MHLAKPLQTRIQMNGLNAVEMGELVGSPITFKWTYCVLFVPPRGKRGCCRNGRDGPPRAS